MRRYAGTGVLHGRHHRTGPRKSEENCFRKLRGKLIMAIKLDIVTPEKQVMSDTVDMVTVPTLSGEAGILPNHAPLISALKPGVLSFTKSGAVQKLAVSGGFVEVGVNTVSVLVETAETAD